jgi:hypothetical protein
MFEHDDFSVVVKIRSNPPKPWRWEIYRAGFSNPLASRVRLASLVLLGRSKSANMRRRSRQLNSLAILLG